MKNISVIDAAQVLIYFSQYILLPSCHGTDVTSSPAPELHPCRPGLKWMEVEMHDAPRLQRSADDARFSGRARALQTEQQHAALSHSR